MAKLRDHQLLIDTDCPMCKAYSGAFVKLNMLSKDGVVDYVNASDEYFDYVDADRARNEIALFDRETKEVKYGLESLIFIITSSFPIFKCVTGNKLFLIFFEKVYKFISYNRKVVIPATTSEYAIRKCEPDFNVKYRLVFIIVLGLMSNLFLYQFLKEIPLYQSAKTTYLEEFILLIIQFVWHAFAIIIFGHKDKLLDYLGQLAVVLFVGGVLLMFIQPLFILFGVTNSFVWFGGLTLVAVIMMLMLYRRCAIIGNANHVIVAWLLFRLAVGAWWFYEWGVF